MLCRAGESSGRVPIGTAVMPRRAEVADKVSFLRSAVPDTLGMQQ